MNTILFSLQKTFYLGVFFCTLLLSTIVQADSITIAVASNFHHTLKQITQAYKTQRGEKTEQITLIAASSGQLYHQITQGAPFDIFFSATPDYVQALARKNLTANNSEPIDFAVGRLALWAPQAKHPAQIQTWLSSPAQHNYKLVIANPELAPYGRAALETLQHLKIDTAWRQRSVRAMNANQAYHFVYSRAAFMGFTSLAHLKQNNVPTEQYWIVPTDHHRQILQQGVILQRTQHNSTTGNFFAFLSSKASQEIIQQSGYQIASIPEEFKQNRDHTRQQDHRPLVELVQ